MSAHTPGPWALEQGACLTVVAADHLGSLADLRSRLDYSGMHPVTAATREANARLIAAAPDLLDALGAILIAMEASGGFDGDEGLFDAGMRAYRKATKAQATA